MNDHPMTETMRLLRADYAEVHSAAQQAEDDLKEAGARKAKAEYAYAKKVAVTRTIHLNAKMPRNEANDRARDMAIEELYELELATSAVRNAESAIRLMNHQLDTVTSLGHLANRELKVLGA